MKSYNFFLLTIYKLRLMPVKSFNFFLLTIYELLLIPVKTYCLSSHYNLQTTANSAIPDINKAASILVIPVSETLLLLLPTLSSPYHRENYRLELPIFLFFFNFFLSSRWQWKVGVCIKKKRGLRALLFSVTRSIIILFFVRCESSGVCCCC